MLEQKREVMPSQLNPEVRSIYGVLVPSGVIFIRTSPFEGVAKSGVGAELLHS